MCENACRDFDLEHVLVEPEQQEEHIDPMHFISWQHIHVVLYGVNIIDNK